MPEAIVAIGEGKHIVGKLRFETDGRRQHSQFEYDTKWLNSKQRFAISPDLPLGQGSQHTTGTRDNKRLALFGCFADAAPDSWGRTLMTRSMGGGLSEFDYLVLSDDRTRQGALRLLDNKMEPLSDITPPVPRLVDLARLRDLTHRFEHDPAGAEEEARDLVGIAGSLGGARPKANVEGDGFLWIAKFTSLNDKKPIERVEVATLKLASQCGLRVAVAKLELRNSENPIALIRRFDRRGDTRIPYISARTALNIREEEAGYYTDIADVIRRISAKPIDDLKELWCRIVFTILVSNTDDHLKNHGFLYVGNDKWRLSPAFDINPSPSRHRILETGIIQGEQFDASIEIALKACMFFEIKHADACRIANEMAQLISNNWVQALKDEGTSVNEVKLYKDAFEHEEVEKALSAL